MAEEKTTPYQEGGRELQPLEWLQSIAISFSYLAGILEQKAPESLDEIFEDYKIRYAGISKAEMYKEVSHSVWERQLYEYIYEIIDVVDEIEPFNSLILQTFKDSAIFPSLLNAIGVLEEIRGEAEFTEEVYWSCLYYRICPTPNEDKGFGERAERKSDRKHELPEGNYENAFKCITKFIETIVKCQYSAKLRESSWVINGYCKLKSGSEKYAEIETEIAKRKRGRKKDCKVKRRNKAIAKYQVNNSQLSWKEIGDKFNVSADIARKACNNPDN